MRPRPPLLTCICRRSCMSSGSARSNSILNRNDKITALFEKLLNYERSILRYFEKLPSSHSMPPNPVLNTIKVNIANMLGIKGQFSRDFPCVLPAVALPRTATAAILAARVRMALFAVLTRIAHFAAALVGLLAVAVLLAAVFRAYCWIER